MKISVVSVEAITWNRDSHDLFDYEARHVNIKRFYVSMSGKLFRYGTDVACIAEGYNIPSCADYLLSIKYHRDGKFVVVPADRSVLSYPTQLNPKKLWIIVRDMPNNKYNLQENDVLKLGRFKMKVRQLVQSDADSSQEIKLDDLDARYTVANPDDEHTAQCRICLLEGNETNDPLVCLCQCKGSIKYIHVSCIRVWIRARLNLPEGEYSSPFFLRPINCELCKTPFPATMVLNNEKFKIVEMPNPTPPFIVLENLTSNRGVHVICMAEKKDLKLGRGHESDVRIPDVSISRCHATIRFVDGIFQLEDHNSKFGTLVALRKAHALEQSEKMAVQVGRSVINLCMEEIPSSLNTINQYGEFITQNEGTHDGNPTSNGVMDMCNAESAAEERNARIREIVNSQISIQELDVVNSNSVDDNNG